MKDQFGKQLTPITEEDELVTSVSSSSHLLIELVLLQCKQVLSESLSGDASKSAHGLKTILSFQSSATLDQCARTVRAHVNTPRWINQHLMVIQRNVFSQINLQVEVAELRAAIQTVHALAESSVTTATQAIATAFADSGYELHLPTSFNALLTQTNKRLLQKLAQLTESAQLDRDSTTTVNLRVECSTLEPREPTLRWQVYSEEQSVALYKPSLCNLANALCSLCKGSHTRTVRAQHTVPLNWEILSARAFLREGKFKEASVTETQYRSNKVFAELKAVCFPFAECWCTVEFEALLVGSCVQSSPESLGRVYVSCGDLEILLCEYLAPEDA